MDSTLNEIDNLLKDKAIIWASSVNTLNPFAAINTAPDELYLVSILTFDSVVVIVITFTVSSSLNSNLSPCLSSNIVDSIAGDIVVYSVKCAITWPISKNNSTRTTILIFLFTDLNVDISRWSLSM